MYQRVLEFLRCPTCAQPFNLETLAIAATPSGTEISEALLHCPGGHWFPVTGGIPRMLPDSLDEHWRTIRDHIGQDASPAVTALATRRTGEGSAKDYDRRTRENFSLEWQSHEFGGTTWGMELDDRVRWFFLEPIGIAEPSLQGMTMLDAGCGNGSQSVAYTRFGLEVVAMDLSSGLEHGHRLRHLLEGARPDLVHFVQGDLQAPPLAPGAFDIIHSAGVIHHTADTEATFRRLTPLLAGNGTFYVWLYKHEPLVTPIIDAIRAVTTRVPPSAFARVATWSAGAFRLFCRSVNRLGLRQYPALSRAESTLALMDIFGAPYAHAHSYAEAAEWFISEGFDHVWPCNDSRRGFGACGRRAVVPASPDVPAGGPGEAEAALTPLPGSMAP